MARNGGTRATDATITTATGMNAQAVTAKRLEMAAWVAEASKSPGLPSSPKIARERRRAGTPVTRLARMCSSSGTPVAAEAKFAVSESGDERSPK